MKKIFLFVLAVLLSYNPVSAGHKSMTDPYFNDDSLRIIEKVYVHTDRRSYYPGDDIWFKAYLVDASDCILTDHSTNLHVELISPSLEIIDSRVIKLYGGLGNGDFHLADNFKSGRYRIRAYTNYMRNFGDELFYNREINIVNTSDVNTSSSESEKSSESKPEIMFFPEGGSLVADVTTKVAFKAIDSRGYALNVSGRIYSSDNKKITEFKSTHKGMGTFLLKPVPGKAYYARISTRSGENLMYDLPGSFSTGIVMSVTENHPEELVITFKTNTETFPLIQNKDLILTVSARNIILKTYSVRIKSTENVFYMETEGLPEGIVMLTLSGKNIPLCERLVFIKKTEDVELKVETDRKNYEQRDSVSVRIFVSDNNYGFKRKNYLSLSAIDDIFADNSSGFTSNIASWFFLESDIRGYVEDPAYYFNTSNSDRLKDLDLLLITQGWRDFKWKYEVQEYSPEYGFTVTGRARRLFVDVPLEDYSVTVGFFQEGRLLVDTVSTDSTGRFIFGEVDLTGEANLIASITNEKDKLKGMLVLDSLRYSPAEIDIYKSGYKIPTSDKQALFDEPLLDLDFFRSENVRRYIQYSEIITSVKRQYKLTDTIKPGEVRITAIRVDAPGSARAKARYYLRGEPDKEMVITPEIERSYNDTYQLIQFNYMSRPKYGRVPAPGMSKPQFMINGMTVPKEDIIHLPLALVERIDVMDRPASYLGVVSWQPGKSANKQVGKENPQYITGQIQDSTMYLPDGIVSIILKEDWFSSTSQVFHSVNVMVSGYDEPRIFYSPKHHTSLEKDYKPDLRTTLLWEPYIDVENNKDFYVNFYNADNSATIKVTVEGISAYGIPVAGTTEYRIK